LDGNLEIFESTVGTRISLCGVEFCKSVSIISTELSKSIELLDCDFKGRVAFSEVSWPERQGATVTARGSKFFSTVSFGGHQAPPPAFFCDVEFASNVSFSGWSDRHLRACFFDELEVAVGEDVEWQSDFVQSLEGGCRTLRKLAEVRGDVNQEHLWHRAEIISRRKTKDTSWAEKIFSVLYGVFADYGLSIFRPLGCLLLITITFSFVYGWIGGAFWFGPLDWNSIEEGFGLSLNRTLPIGVFSDDQNVWRKELLGKGGDIKDIGVRMLATIQSVISAILIYLGVMAVRRKFRIS
jgi:hypothetical protein